MLEQIKTLLKQRGAWSRIMKQSRQAVPAISDDGRKILGFLSEHQDELISIKQISRGAKVPESRVGTAIKRLVSEKIIVKSESKPGKGTRYWIHKGSKPSDSFFSYEDLEVSSSGGSR